MVQLPITNLSKKQINKLRKQNKLRSELEVWLDFHNHKMELVRTVLSLLGFVASTIVLLKIFKLI
jgi:hypothetical protein